MDVAVEEPPRKMVPAGNLAVEAMLVENLLCLITKMDFLELPKWLPGNVEQTKVILE